MRVKIQDWDSLVVEVGNHIRITHTPNKGLTIVVVDEDGVCTDVEFQSSGNLIAGSPVYGREPEPGEFNDD
jgi:hypothetical protein